MDETRLPALNCAGCRKCCLGDKITLLPERGDNPANYKTRRSEDGKLELRRTKEGHCIYLGKSGCQIHGRAPFMCRIYDCRVHYLRIEKLGPLAIARRLGANPERSGFREGQARVLKLRET